MASELRLAEATDGGRALTQHVALAKGSKGKALAAVLTRAMDDPNCLVFAELLALPTVGELLKAAEGSDEKKAVDSLTAMAYGTYLPYTEGVKAGKLNALSDNGTKKLRQLTIATLAYGSQRLPYEQLMHELEMSDLRALEDLVIDAVYAGVVACKLDQSNKCIVVSGVMGRDVRLEDVSRLGDALKAWSRQSESLIAKLNEEIQESDKIARETSDRRMAHEAQVEETKEVIKATMDADNGMLAGFDPNQAAMAMMMGGNGGGRRDMRQRRGPGPRN